jgi:hypothetical protein
VREAGQFHRVHRLQQQAGRCGLQSGLRSEARAGGNTNIVVRRDPGTGEATRVLAYRW